MAMPDFIGRNRASLKLLFIGFISLLMLIPLAMVRELVSERSFLQTQARNTIAHRWGLAQTVSGLVIVTEVDKEYKTDRGVEWHKKQQATLPVKLDLHADLVSEIRYLGIYEVPVYTIQLSIQGEFDWRSIEQQQPKGDLKLWLPMDDVRGVRQVSHLILGELELPAEPLSLSNNQFRGVQFILPAEQRAGVTDHYRLNLSLAGSQVLNFLPLAQHTTISLDSDWPHPEFIGQYLPASRSIETDRVTADWSLLGLNRPYGNQWLLDEMDPVQLNQASFGMRLETPADIYQRNERSVKYSLLFIALTFLALFLFEVISNRPLHPVQYLFTGGALAVFYLVLLALSEYLHFALAYGIAATVLVLIVTGYTGVILGARRRGLLIGLLLAVTYGLLYFLVVSEHLSLLIGSLALLAIISLLMYLTRHVDWYRYGGQAAAA